MGVAKLLLPLAGQTVIEHTLSAWRSSRVTSVFVTVHPDADLLATVCRNAGAEVIVPSEPPEDMKASIGAALEHIRAGYAPKPTDVWLLAPADMPQLSNAVIDQLLQASLLHPGDLIVPTHQGRRGHPALFPWKSAADVARLAPDQGVNQLLKQASVREVPVDVPRPAGDLDTPTDYERLRRKMDSGD